MQRSSPLPPLSTNSYDSLGGSNYQSSSRGNSPRPCKFFAQGNFPPPSPVPAPLPPQSPLQATPPPILVNIPPGHPIFSIDVECVATGTQHNARSVAQVALVNEWNQVIFNVYIKQDVPVVSYLTELTGITKEVLEQYGTPLAEALAQLRAYLTPAAILVGQSILKDVQWLQLAVGVDYHSLIDLSDLFKVWNPYKNSMVTFSQDHCAKVWLGVPDRHHHDAVEDARISMSLFKAYLQTQWDPMSLYQMQQRTLKSPRVPGFSSLHPVLEGCCMGNRNKCSCGAPFD